MGGDNSFSFLFLLMCFFLHLWEEGDDAQKRGRSLPTTALAPLVLCSRGGRLDNIRFDWIQVSVASLEVQENSQSAARCESEKVSEGALAGLVIQLSRSNLPRIVGQKAFLNLNCGYVHLEQETCEGECLEKEKLPILERLCLIHLRSG